MESERRDNTFGKMNQLKVGSLLSYLQMGASILIQLIYTPLMIRLLGSSEYGLYNTVSSTISMMGILSLGFNAGYLRYYSIYKKKGDSLSIQKLNGLMLLIFIFIGIVSLICGLYLSFHLNMVFDKGLTHIEYGIARVLMLLLTINLTFSFPMSVFINIISAHERFIFLKLVGMIQTICGPLVTLPLLLLGYKSIALVTVSVTLSFISYVLYLYYVLVVMGEKFVFHKFDDGLLRDIFGFTIFIAINTVIDQINWNIDKLILARYKGTAEVAIYSVGFTLYNCYMHFSTAISGVFAPRVHQIVNDTNEELERQKRELTDLFTKVGRMQFILLGLIASGIFFFGKYFIVYIWAGEQYDKSYYVSLLLILPASIALIQNIGIEIQRAENRHQFRSIAYMIMAIINLGLSVYLCQIYGSVGSAFGTAFSLVVANGFIMNIYYHKKCNIDIIYFWKSVLGLARGIILPLIFGALLRYVIWDVSLIQYVILILVYIVVYCISMRFLGMNEYEKKLIQDILNSLIKKGKA